MNLDDIFINWIVSIFPFRLEALFLHFGYKKGRKGFWGFGGITYFDKCNK